MSDKQCLASQWDGDKQKHGTAGNATPLDLNPVSCDRRADIITSQFWEGHRPLTTIIFLKACLSETSRKLQGSSKPKEPYLTPFGFVLLLGPKPRYHLEKCSHPANPPATHGRGVELACWSLVLGILHRPFRFGFRSIHLLRQTAIAPNSHVHQSVSQTGSFTQSQ